MSFMVRHISYDFNDPCLLHDKKVQNEAKNGLRTAQKFSGLSIIGR